MLDASLYRKKLKEIHRKADPEKLERRSNKPSAISQSDDQISMLSRVKKRLTGKQNVPKNNIGGWLTPN